MKRNILQGSLLFVLALFMATWLISCREKPSIENPMLTMDSISVDDETEHVLCKLAVEYPTKGPAPLLRSISEFISESLGDGYKGDISDVRSMVKYYQRAQKDSLQAYLDSEQDYIPPEQLSYWGNVTKIYESPTLVTFQAQVYTYLGGAHGGISPFAVSTFRKSDGRKFGVDMLRRGDGIDIQPLLIQGLKEYFEVTTDEELLDCLFVEHLYEVRLPENPPYIMENGVAFTYQQYEIAAYAYGMPSFTIPFEKIAPYLVRSVRELITF